MNLSSLYPPSNQWQQPWRAGMVAPQQTDPFQQMMTQMMSQRSQQQQAAGPNIADFAKLLAPTPTHEAAGNIQGGGSLFNNPNFYNAQGQRTGPAAAPQAQQFVPPQMIATGGPATGNPYTTPGNSGIFNGMGHQLMPGTMPVPGMMPQPMIQHPLQGLFNTPGMRA